MKSLFLFMVQNGGFVSYYKVKTVDPSVEFVAGAGLFSVKPEVVDKMIEENYLTQLEKSDEAGFVTYIPNCNHPDYPDTTFMWRQMYELIEEKLGMKRVVN